MIRPYELFIGLRYTRAKRRNHFISFISMSSMLGTALGVMALITVLSVMNGFGKELRTRILGVASHLTISGDNGRLRDSHAVEQVAAGFPGVLGSAPYVRMRASAMKVSRVNHWRACWLAKQSRRMLHLRSISARDRGTYTLGVPKSPSNLGISYSRMA